MAAMHGTLPTSVEKDLQSLVLFFVSPVQFQYDKKTGQIIPSTKEQFREKLTKSLQLVGIYTIVLNLMDHHNYDLFGRREVKSFWDLLNWRNIRNNYFMACKCGSKPTNLLFECLTSEHLFQTSWEPRWRGAPWWWGA